MIDILLAGVGGQGTVLAAKVLAQAAQRDLLDERINYFLGNSLHHIGQGNTGSDCIHSNTLRTQFSGKGNRQAIDSKFGCGISKATGLAVNADH